MGRTVCIETPPLPCCEPTSASQSPSSCLLRAFDFLQIHLEIWLGYAGPLLEFQTTTVVKRCLCQGDVQEDLHSFTTGSRLDASGPGIGCGPCTSGSRLRWHMNMTKGGCTRYRSFWPTPISSLTERSCKFQRRTMDDSNNGNSEVAL